MDDQNTGFAGVSMTVLPVAALCWARDGWPVFPLVPGSKAPFRGSHGVADATCDEDQVRDWWARWPRANIGAACSGRFVLDLDLYKPGAREWLASAELTSTHEHTSPRGGVHLVYADLEGGCYRGKLAPGVDIKAGPGAVVVLPPSWWHGKPYAVRDWRPPVPVPGWLREAAGKDPGNGGGPSAPPAPEPIAALTARERRAITSAIPPGKSPSEHTHFVVCQAIRSGRTDGQVATVLEHDPVTRERWARKPSKRWFDLTSGLARARAELAQ